MDIARPDVKRKKTIRRIAWGAAAVIAIPLVTFALSRLKPAAPGVDKSSVWTDTVKRGPMVREVRGLGTLVPETIRLIPAATDGRVDQRFILPGTPVRADTPILQLTNPTLQQVTLDAEYQMKGAEAQYNSLKAQLENQLMDLKAKAATSQADASSAKLDADRKEQLFKLGLAPDIDYKISQVKAEQTSKQDEISQNEVTTFANSVEAQLAVQQSKVEQQRALWNLQKSQLDRLTVRPGIDGVLQELEVEVGQNVTAGTLLARVAQPTHLKAQLRIAETQAKDIQIGQKATVDTHNGVVAGHVMRIDPAVLNGTVTVDVALDAPPPDGARPDLSVEGTIELERLADVVFVGRPVHGEPNSTVGLFKLVPGSNEAVRVQVALGRTSVNTVEIVKGLQVGDEVILSDMSAMDNYDRIQLK
ncbi:MAG: HlyD family efflux transporter periplasmic adaptor subunit [Candidatus Acidiferrales bacterium]